MALSLPAPRGGHLEVATALIGQGAELNARGTHGATPILLAALHDHMPLVRQLMAAGADWRITDADGVSPFDGLSSDDMVAYLGMTKPSFKAAWG